MTTPTRRVLDMTREVELRIRTLNSANGVDHARCVIARTSQTPARYAHRMNCPRCANEMTGTTAGAPWCTECETQYYEWVRQHAADILWQTGGGALLAMVIGLGLPLLGLSPVIGIAGVLAGFGTFMGLRRWGKQRRRRQFIAGALPRAYLPSKT